MITKLVALIPVLLLAGCNEAVQETGQAPSPPRVPVSTQAAATVEWPSLYEATGTVRARSASTVASKWMGYVRQVNVQAGDSVTAGQALIVLDARDLDTGVQRAVAAREEVRNAIPEADSAIAAAKANLDLAQVTLKRMNELYQKQSISDQEFDECSARLKSAQAAFEMARAKRSQLDAKLAQAGEDIRSAEVARSYAEIQAPAAGLVTAKSVEPGNLVTPGAPLLTIEHGGYRLEAAVEEAKLPAIRIGQAVTVTLDGIDGASATRVSEIVPAVDAASRAYIVKIDLPANPLLRSGVFGRASFPVGSRAVLAVSAAAVMERGQLQAVFVNDRGVARTRLVTLGDRLNDQVEILSGLNAGEEVIAPAPQGLADGSRLDVRR